MIFSRPDLHADLVRLRSSRYAPDRAFGDNFEFEERVGDARRDAFEAAGVPVGSVLALQADHFRMHVQGALHDHIPVTFTAVNHDALYAPDIDGNQKIVRIECLDDVLTKIGRSFADIEDAVKSGHRGDAIVAQLLDQWRLYPGARPAFVAFKSEVVTDIGAPDWLLRLRNRMGLGHYDPAAGQRQAFALMEYLVKDVIAEWLPLETRGAKRPFAFPTVLESRASPYFYPGPRDLPSSFALDLTDPARNPIREMLHVRITYRVDHLVKVGELVGLLPPVRLGAARDRHLDRLRRDGGRVDFGAPMSSDVDE